MDKLPIQGTYNTPEGLLAAMLSPFAMTVGFFIWEGAWKGSAFGLNVFKGCLASCIFIFTIMIGDGFSRIFRASFDSIGFLLVSSLLGIVVGDSLWLQALGTIGARRVIVIDSIKPGLGALLATLMLGEPCGWSTIVGVLLSTAGILMVCLEEKKDKEKDDQANDGSSSSSSSIRSGADEQKQTEGQTSTDTTVMWGYFLAFLNVLFDAYGAVLTKEYGIEASFNTFEINLVRFGAASMCLLWVMGLARILDAATKENNPATATAWEGGAFSSVGDGSGSGSGSGVEFTVLSTSAEDADEEQQQHLDVQSEGSDGAEDDSVGEGIAFKRPEPKWFQMPDMEAKNWALVACGVLFVTYIANSLSNFALLETEMSVCLTLTSTGPIISLPVGYFLRNEAITIKAVAGSILSVAGIAVLTMG